MSLYILNDGVSVKGTTIKLNEIEVFECNKDALDMLQIMYDYTQRKMPFCTKDIISQLQIEHTEDNIFSIDNAIRYLKGCFIINEC